MTNDETDTRTHEQGEGRKTSLSRRELMQAGSGVAATALLSKYWTDPVQAQSSTSEPRIRLGDDWVIDDLSQPDGDTDLQFVHSPSGNTLSIDAVEELLSFAGTDIIDSGEVVAPVNNQSVSTDEVDTTFTDGATKAWRKHSSGSGAFIEQQTQPTTSVSTTAKGIYTLAGNRIDEVTVMGINASDGSKRFLDKVTMGGGSSPEVEYSHEQGTIPSRTYSRDSSTVDLAMASDTYDVIAVGTGAIFSNMP